MQIRNKKNLIGAFLALVIALSVSAALGYSQGRPDRGGDHGGRGMHGGFGPFARNLNLSDAQKAQMQQIAARYEASTKSLRDQLHSLHKNQADSFGGGAFDENAVRQAAQARATVEVELEVSRAHMMSEMFALLTPEQKAQLAQQRQQWEQRRQQREHEGNKPDDQ